MTEQAADYDPGEGPMDHLKAALPPKPVTVHTSIGAFEVSPLTVGKLAEVLEVAQPVFTAAMMEGQQDLLALMSHYSGELIAAVSVLTDSDDVIIRALTPEEFLLLLGACIRVNRDFFTRLQPVIASLLEQVQHGRTQSSH